MESRDQAQQVLLEAITPIATSCPILKQAELLPILHEVSALEKQYAQIREQAALYPEGDEPFFSNYQNKLTELRDTLFEKVKLLRATLVFLRSYTDELPQDAILSQFT